MEEDGKKLQSQACLRGCCPSPFLTSHDPQTKPSRPMNSSAACRRDFASKTSSSIFPNAQFSNHESLPSIHESFAEFTEAYPQYSDTVRVDQIRAQEYYHLSFSNHTCLDYLGTGLFSYSQLQKHESPTYRIPRNLKTQLLHGGATSELESAIRTRIMSSLNVQENEYSMVFTANKTSAFKLVAESYPFQSNGNLLSVYDYESEAIEAMLNSSEKKGARVMSAEFSWPRLRIQSSKLRNMLVSKKKKQHQMKKRSGLFVFPLHSRMTGARYPYLWMTIAEENGWHVLIDACALGPKDMDSFGLSLFRPDFLICSFYKVFGDNPSGFACLFVKNSTIPMLETSITPGIIGLIPAEKLTESPGTDAELENLSSQFGRVEEVAEKLKGLEMIEVDNLKPKGEVECRGLDQVDSLGLLTISNRARCLVNWLLTALLKLQHPNTKGTPLVRIYGPKVRFDRGPAIAFNVFDWKGEKIEPVLVQKLADRSNISLSYGFLHHIWFADKYQEDKEKVMERSNEPNSENGNKEKRKTKWE
ncbi:small nuclear ribonucleoprotein [Hibiscus syriacus]|uniref:Small nuclear ribonucleoprotein n=1 Tax=Hibiscus syriacus TaxID=106335 RepID=A0A6A2YSF8_HIBSY|nr:small nuclear ribonucleoprotein [Hibiscus syriacus]